MYIPSFNTFTDKQEVLRFMQKYSFGTIVNAVDNIPVATQLPFLVEEKDDQIIISSHFAKANSQWRNIGDNDVLVIFTEPHAYVSPLINYEKKSDVPTWNYIAVHIYGKMRLLETEQQHMDLLELTINNYETAYLKQWEQLPIEYRSKMVKGIVGFEITVKDIQAKSKLSQNRSDIEKTNIINSLSKSEDTNEREIAAYMTELKKNNH